MEPFEKRGNFEQAFSLAFEGAEIAPEAHIWDRIDAGLAKAQSGSYRKRLLFFQLVAAASLVFAASITLFQIFKSDIVSNKPIVSSEKTIETNEEPLLTEDPGKDHLVEESPIIPLIVEEPDEEQRTLDDPGITTPIDEDAIINPLITDIENDITEENQFTPDSKYSEGSIGITSLEYYVITGLVEYEPELIPIWTKKEEKRTKSDMWANAGLATGSYNPSSGGLNLGLASADEAFATPAEDNQGEPMVFSDEQSGRSIGGGIGFGGRVGEKWSLESGLNYIHSEIDGTTNSFIESNGRNYPVFYDTNFAGSVQNTSSFGVTSSLDFITVPFKAGYILVDKKVGWVATGGFGSNILIGNSLSSDLGQLDQVKYSVSSSPYRRLSWSGIIGTEVYFNITEDYQLMVVPQYNFGITEITKQESSFTIVPNSFNLGLRFRYLLK